jgi:hypothetical protein
MKKLLLLLFIFIAFFRFGYSQTFLNGDFETTTCPAFCDWGYINISNPFFSANMSNSFGFGPGGSIDIMHTTCTWGPAQNGNYFVGFDFNSTSPSHNAFSMQLSTPLTTGASYTISFADKGHPCCVPPGPVELTLSTVNNAIGTTIFVGPNPTVAAWNVRTFTFNAPNNGQFITVRALSPGFWTQVDNFRFITPLPAMDNLQLSAKNIGTNTLVSWKLEDETDIKQYIVERSVNGSVFEEIKTLPCNQYKIYQTEDNLYYKGTALYRIALVDKDGIFHYSKTVEVSKNECEESAFIKVYPNPAHDFVTIESSFEKAQFEIIDMQGKVLHSQNATLHQNIDITSFAKGIYTIKLISEKGETLYQKLFVY